MAIRTYKVTLDTKNAIAPEPVYLRQGDKTGAVVIDATLMDNGAPVSLDGLTPMFKANTADGKAVIADSTGFNIVNASGGEFTYQVPNALSSVPGKIVTAYFSFSDTSGTESTFDVAFIIKKAVDITQAQADDYITIIDGTLQSLQQKINAMNTDIQTILNAFNQGDFYNRAQTDNKDAATLASANSYSNGLVDFNLGNGIKYAAHRGDNAEWPENSLLSFKHVTRHWGIESDISVTKDGYWVIMHDDTVDRMTNGTGAVKDLTLAQIQALRIDSGNNVANCNASDLVIPTVEQYLTICKAHNKCPFLEIKNANYTSQNYDSLASIIERYGMAKMMILISFDFDSLKEMKSRIPAINVMWIANDYTNDNADKAASLGINSGIDIGNYSTLTKDNVSYAHSKGLKFGIWTPSDDSSRDTWESLGIDYVTTNSLSGNLRYSLLTMDSDAGWTENGGSSTETEPSHIEEIGRGKVRILLNIKNGNTNTGKIIARLPDWAQPIYRVWGQAAARTSTGVQAASIDIRSSIDSDSTVKGCVITGLSMTTKWTYMDKIYRI
jgi:glycerophosphoryl diester phosphodiesterase